ncbi:MAG TPA: hypothetical protein VLA15_08400 [Desulfurivibrionaceae bacterium]|nr:hypothetical protein [Desulfurivibrionaceae bacterium]
MKITDPSSARRFIEEWRPAPITSQLKNLRLARETLELDQMYYEQKGNSGGVARCAVCLEILREREAELQG